MCDSLGVYVRVDGVCDSLGVYVRVDGVCDSLGVYVRVDGVQTVVEQRPCMCDRAVTRAKHEVGVHEDGHALEPRVKLVSVGGGGGGGVSRRLAITHLVVAGA